MNSSTVYIVEGGEDGFPCICIDSLDFEQRVKVHPLVTAGAPIGDYWDIKNPCKEGGGEFAEFSALTGAPTNLIAIREDIFRDSSISKFFTEPAEYIRVDVSGVRFIFFNPTQQIEAGKKSGQPELYPCLIKCKLPESGFFRIPNSLFIYYAEPETGGLKKYFDTSGMIGLRFEKQTVVDE